jgi:maleylpyruvate isomerase
VDAPTLVNHSLHYVMTMNAPGTAAAEQLDNVRTLVRYATQQLLGDTISVSDDDWRAASRLPDWTRGHVATHLARHADGMGRLVEWARTGERQEMYASPEQRTSEIEGGSGRSGLDLQIDLDTSAGRLAAGFEALDAADRWDAIVELRDTTPVPARLLPLSRLLEVIIHHVDLDIGYEVDHVDQQTAEWLLEWCAYRFRSRDDFPRLTLTSDSGFTVHVGKAGEPRQVSGTSPNLLGWLMNRVDSSAVTGADGLKVPGL